MDWNSDGKKDLMAGSADGKVRIYLNTNTDENPVFSGYFFLQAGGATFDCGNYSAPCVEDWNNDGKKDLLCGENLGRVHLLINEGTDADPLFNTVEFVKDGSKNLKIGANSAPAVLDLNGDGRKDLLLGEAYGGLYYVENRGTDEDPIFDGFVPATIGSVPIDLGYHSKPDVVDWDGDGVLDVICGNFDGNVALIRAIGPLALSDNRILESIGGKIWFSLDAGQANAGRCYLILGSLSGTMPGIPLPGGQAVLPVNWDGFTNAALGLVNTSIFQQFLGALDGSGSSFAVLDAASPAPGAAGFTMSFAYALCDPWDFASNGAAIEIVP